MKLRQAVVLLFVAFVAFDCHASTDSSVPMWVGWGLWIGVWIIGAGYFFNPTEDVRVDVDHYGRGGGYQGRSSVKLGERSLPPMPRMALAWLVLYPIVTAYLGWTPFSGSTGPTSPPASVVADEREKGDARAAEDRQRADEQAAREAEAQRKRLDDAAADERHRNEEAVGRAKEMRLDLGVGTTVELVQVPAGEFNMGFIRGGRDERPIHNVSIPRPFKMGKYPVTQAQYERVMGGNPSSFKGRDLPVESVTHADAQEFCAKASATCGQRVRLPTEAEWEYACRAGATTMYNLGDDDEAMRRAGWFNANAEQRTHPVGSKAPNAWGLFDMHGNVWQWCQDWYAEDYYAKSPSYDPQGPAQGVLRVLRGGCWESEPFACRSAARYELYAGTGFYNVGFRVVVESSR